MKLPDNCEEILERLSLYIDDELPDDEKQAVSVHLENCAECREIYTGLLDTVTSTKLLAETELELPDGFHEQVMQKIRDSKKPAFRLYTEKEKEPRKAVDWGLWLGRYGTVAAGLLITVFLFGGAAGILQSFTMPKSAVTGASEGGLAAMSAAPAAPAPAVYGVQDELQLSDAEFYLDEPENYGAQATEAPAAAQSVMMASSPEVSNDIQAGAAEADISYNNSRQAAVSEKSAQGAVPDASIKNYHLYIEVKDFDAAVEAVNGLQGYNISSESFTNSWNDSQTARMTRVVDAASYGQVINQLKSLGKSRSESETERKVVSELIDLDARIRAREQELERLFGLLERSESVEAMASIEQRLESVSRELDSLKSQQRYYISNNSSPTITLEIVSEPRQPVVTKETFTDRVENSFIMSLNVTLMFFEGAMLLLSTLSVPLVIIAVLASIIYGVYKARRRRAEHE